MKNYIGEEIGKFEILNQKQKGYISYLYCKCKKCGKEKWYEKNYINKAKCCERKNARIKTNYRDMSGQTINNILIIKRVYQNEAMKEKAFTLKRYTYQCQCFCGNIFYAPLCEIESGRINSCGCTKDIVQSINYPPETSLNELLNDYLQNKTLYKIDKLDLIKKIYKYYLKKSSNYIVVDLETLNNYLKNGNMKEQIICKLNNILIDRFEKNNYVVYRENEEYTENGKVKIVKEGTVVAIKK